MRTPSILLATLLVACADPPLGGVFVVVPASAIHVIEQAAPHTFAIRLADTPTSDVRSTLDLWAAGMECSTLTATANADL